MNFCALILNKKTKILLVEFVALKDCFQTMNSSTDKHRTRKLCLIQTVQKDYVMSLSRTGHRNKKHETFG